MSIKNFLRNVFQPSSKILNSKNKNHWIAMVRGIMINKYNWSRKEASLYFTYAHMQNHFKEGLTPSEAIAEEMLTWED